MATYVVKRGDSLSSIASKYGISWKDLYNQNKSVIGSNPNLIYSGQKYNIPGTTTSTSTPTTTTPTKSLGTSAGEKAKVTPWGEVLPWEEYFNPELVKGSAMETAAAYYAPMAQRNMETLESEFADRGLIRSGARGKSIRELYDNLGRQQRFDIEADIAGEETRARQEYNMMQDMYEQSQGEQQPSSRAYEAYNIAAPTTSAGRYGSTYLDWLNNVLK